MPDAALALSRAFVPRWSFAPLSGEGATGFGGRWNPPGAPTIYAARELSTAWAEHNQGFVQHPATIARLELTGADLADLTDADTLERLDIPADIHAYEWRAMLDAGAEPATYAIRRKLLEDGRHGIVYPSFMSPGGTCVALWRWNAAAAPRLEVVDPEERLPKSPASWR